MKLRNAVPGNPQVALVRALTNGTPWVCAVLAVMVVAVSGCQPSQPAESAGEAELFHLRGEIRPDHQWPARGSLTGDAELVAEVTQVVDQWQTPEGVGRYPSPVYSSIAWLGEVDGQVLGVVVFAPADDRTDRWVLEVTGQPGDLVVTEWRDFGTRVTNMIEDAEVLPIRSPGFGPRYLTSARINRLTVDGVEVAVAEGLSEPVEVGRCGMVELVAEVDGGHLVYGDLGAGVEAPFYPLFFAQVIPPSGVSDVARLQDVDTCAGAAETGWLGSVRELFAPDMLAAMSWGELAEIGAGEFRGTVEDIALYGSGQDQRAIVIMWRPESGPPVLSTAEQDWLRPESLTFGFHTDEGPIGVLMYPSGVNVTLEREFRDVEVSAEAMLLAAEPHVIVVALPDHEIEVSYTRDGEREQVGVEAP
ncbi:hypothetical protein JQS43_08550 [Natronosporangium hydrolyticum]|uniref:Uncharacterized protein n=1 Tax=Natronosporangium hydrolyticum TaxID=2811111 RepID=A0A895YLY3_9ACTN|nr:hypothetical protein [Natronosporangium hydrolyticum]QSB16323.1 hypothetical protein JQS43_08550 [Natronosporangium hydrolyticum]